MLDPHENEIEKRMIGKKTDQLVVFFNDLMFFQHKTLEMVA